MSQKFKDFDKQFAALKGSGLQWTYENLENLPASTIHWDVHRIKTIESWKSLVGLGYAYEVYSQELVQRAVYDCVTAAAWQEFRVRLKGLSTQEKLYCLACWYKHFLGSHYDLTRVRVCNYLGALIRAGLLDEHLVVTERGRQM